MYCESIRGVNVGSVLYLIKLLTWRPRFLSKFADINHTACVNFNNFRRRKIRICTLELRKLLVTKEIKYDVNVDDDNENEDDDVEDDDDSNY